MSRHTCSSSARRPGAGKTSLVNARCWSASPDIELSISYTTRAPRPGRATGASIISSTRETFVRHARARRVPRKRRGARQPLRHLAGLDRAQRAAGRDILLEIDWQGAQQVRRIFPTRSASSSCRRRSRSCERRLRARGQDSDEVIAAAAASRRARRCAMSAEFDYVIINNDFEEARAIDLVARRPAAHAR